MAIQKPFVETIDASELADVSELDEETAEKVVHVMQRRAQNRGDSSETANVVAFEEWAYEEWSDYDISAAPIRLAARVEDHSEKAYKLEGAFDVEVDLIEATDLEDLAEHALNDLVTWVDETDTEFVDQKGHGYVPKSAVTGVYDLEV